MSVAGDRFAARATHYDSGRNKIVRETPRFGNVSTGTDVVSLRDSSGKIEDK